MISFLYVCIISASITSIGNGKYDNHQKDLALTMILTIITESYLIFLSYLILFYLILFQSGLMV